MSRMVLGLMSGTSADGVDAVVAEFGGYPGCPRWQVLNKAQIAYPQTLRTALIDLGQGVAMTAERILDLTESLTHVQADAARLCDPHRRATLVGCHGQTVWHRPAIQGRRGSSWQLLQAPLLAHLLGRPVVHDFRSADLALGGQGAPLAPPVDMALMGRIGGWRAVLNLGGIANLTLIPPLSGPDRHAALRGWDCGPGNTLIDLAVGRLSGGRLSCDENGAWAARGDCNDQLIRHWLSEPYFQTSPPKSTGREQFGSQDLDRRLAQLEEREGTLQVERTSFDAAGPTPWQANALATLTAFSAAAVAADLELSPRPVELVVAGGGRHNPSLMNELRRRCRGVRVFSSDELGLDTQAREAMAMALLAWWHERGHQGSVVSVTGASRPSVLGMRVNPPGAWTGRDPQLRGR